MRAEFFRLPLARAIAPCARQANRPAPGFVNTPFPPSSLSHPAISIRFFPPLPQKNKKQGLTIRLRGLKSADPLSHRGSQRSHCRSNERESEPPRIEIRPPAVLPPCSAHKGMRQGQGREQAEGKHRLKRLRRIRPGIERIAPVLGARFARSDRPRPSTDRLCLRRRRIAPKMRARTKEGRMLKKDPASRPMGKE